MIFGLREVVITCRRNFCACSVLHGCLRNLRLKSRDVNFCSEAFRVLFLPFQSYLFMQGFGGARAKDIVSKELGRPVDEIFQDFSDVSGDLLSRFQVGGVGNH